MSRNIWSKLVPFFPQRLFRILRLMRSGTPINVNMLPFSIILRATHRRCVYLTAGFITDRIEVKKLDFSRRIGKIKGIRTKVLCKSEIDIYLAYVQ